ncbi:MAG: hypothetical protein J5685_08020 [Clostridiales bacterium]|nr:hypothetical protein [Clostridiales bacterium]
MKTKKHVILDHPILSYFLLLIFTVIMANIFSSIIDVKLLAALIPGYGTEMEVLGRTTVSASGAGTSVGAVAAAVVAFFWGLYLIRKSKRQEIIDLWNGKWKTAVTESNA